MPTFTVKEKTKSKQSETADAILLQAVIKYKELQAKLVFHQESIRKEMEASRLIIENAAKHAPEGKIVTPDYKILLIDVERENFDKKAAIAKLGRAKLAPFMSVTKFQQLRVS